MEWKEILVNVLYLVVTGVLLPLVGIGIAKFTSWIKAKTQNDTFDKTIDITTKLVGDCVGMVLQTYVAKLKEEGKFDAEAQKMAFNLAMENVKKLITKDAQKVIETVYGDFDAWLATKIEAKVGELKK